MLAHPSAFIAMGATPTKVQSSLVQLRGTPVEVWSKSEGRWIEAVIGAPKDVREAPPETTAVLVLFKEVVGGRTDAYKWIKADDIHQFIRARPEAKRQAGMFDSMASFSTMFEHRSNFEKRDANGLANMVTCDANGYGGPKTQHGIVSLGAMATAPQHPQHPQNHMASLGPMGTIPVERPEEQPGVMSSIMASVGIGAVPSQHHDWREHHPPSSMASMAPSMASTIDHNSSRLERAHMGRVGGMGNMQSVASTIPEERPGFMSSITGSSSQQQQQKYHPNVYMPQAMMTNPQPHDEHQGGVMASLMGMGGSIMGSQSGSMASMTSMAAPNENVSPNRTPNGSTNGKTQAPAANPMSSFMSSMGFTAVPESHVSQTPPRF